MLQMKKNVIVVCIWHFLKCSSLLSYVLCVMLQLMSMFEDILQDTKQLKENNNDLAKKVVTGETSVNLSDSSIQYYV